MKFIKTIAAFMAAGLMLTATGCAAGGSKAKEAMTDAVDSYLSKVLAGKPAKKLVDAKNEAGFDNLGSAQMDLLTIVMSKSAYEITDPKPGKDEGSLTVEFKYPDLDEISSKVTDSGVDALKNAIEASDEDDLKTKKIEFKLVLKDDDWLISKKSDSKFKSFLEDIVKDFRASGTTPTTTAPDIDPTDNSGSSSGLAKVGISMPTKDLMRWKQDGDTILNQIGGAGYEVDLQYASNSVETQIAQITNMINSGCSVIIVAPIEGSSLNAVLEFAASKGIKIIAYDRLIRDTENVDYYVTFDNFEVGRLQGEYIVKALGLGEGKGPFNIEITAGDPGDNNAVFSIREQWMYLSPTLIPANLLFCPGRLHLNRQPQVPGRQILLRQEQKTSSHPIIRMARTSMHGFALTTQLLWVLPMRLLLLTTVIIRSLQVRTAIFLMLRTSLPESRLCQSSKIPERLQYRQPKWLSRSFRTRM